jgi:hypothetical protein
MHGVTPQNVGIFIAPCHRNMKPHKVNLILINGTHGFKSYTKWHTFNLTTRSILLPSVC